MHIVHLAVGDAVAAIRARPSDEGPAAHGRDLPALPVPRGRGDSRRRHALQVRAADPRAREPRGAVARRCSTASSTSSSRDHSPCTAGAEAGRARRLSRPRGAASRRCSSASPRSGPRRARRGARLDRAGRLDERARPRALAGLGATQGADRRRARRRPGGLGPGRAFAVDAERLFFRHKISPYVGAALRGPRAADVRCAGRGLRRQRHIRPGRSGARSSAPGAPHERHRRDAAAFTGLIDLAAAQRWAASALGASDDFFAGTENLLEPGPRRLHRGQVHRPRQVDGRLGEPPQARRPATTGACSSWARRATVRRLRRRHRTTSSATTPPFASVEGVLGAARHAADERCRRASWTRAARRRSPLRPDAQNLFAAAPAGAGHAPAAQHLPRRRRGALPRLRPGRRRAGRRRARRRDARARGRRRSSISRRVKNGGARARLLGRVLRPDEQPAPARARREHGRRLGDAAQARRRATTGS